MTPVPAHPRSRRPARRTELLAVAALAAMAAMAGFGTARANTPDWQPDASERLVKLPASYLEQAVQQDFRGSELAGALADIESKLKARTQSLAETKQALKQASDEKMRTELQHQLLVQKRGFVKLLGQRADLRRRQIETRIDLYNNLLADVRANEPASKAQADLIEKQKEAAKRFESVVDKVDMKMFGSVAAERSDYNKEYTENRQAMERLVKAIQEHPLSDQATIDGEAVTKKQYLQRLVSRNEAQLALLDQKESMFGYMAKLVALDAMALSTGIGQDGGGSGGDSGSSVTAASAVDAFLDN